MSEVICLPFDGQKTLRSYEEPKIEDPTIYPRNWSSYHQARQNEKPFALELLYEALRILKVRSYGFGAGRPPFPLTDKIFCCVQKVLRWTTYDANEEYIDYANLRKWITSVPRPHTVSDFMNDPQITPILEQLIILLSTPLAHLEESFSIDSTGLSTHDKSRWVNVRLEKTQHKDYKKIHTIIGNKTKIIVSAEVTIANKGDSPMLLPLLDKMSKYFKIKEFCGDGAYASRKNTQAIADLGAVPYFRLRKDARSLSKGFPAWSKMVRAFKNDSEKYSSRYHQRSNVESAYSSFKTKVSEFLKSKTTVAKTNEALCIAATHNLYSLVNASFCYGVDVVYKK